MKKVVLLVVLTVLSSSIYADKVERVYVCGDNVYIKLKTNGYVAAFDSQVGEKNVDRILSVALTLLSTGNDTGYFAVGAPIASCGISSVRPITTFGIDSN